MHHRERLFIYAALLLLGGMQLCSVFNSFGRAALASPSPQRFLDDLGPADRVILIDDDDAENELAIFNRNGRPAWGDAPTHAAYNIAFVNIDPLINGIMRTDGYTEDRENLSEEVRRRDEDLVAERNALQEKMNGMTQDNPEFQRLLAEAQALYQRHMEFRNESSIRRGQMEAGQLQRAFKEMVTGIEIIAERLDIDIVTQFTPIEEEFTAQNRMQANQDIRVRNVLRYPEGLDITAEVMDELALELE